MNLYRRFRALGARLYRWLQSRVRRSFGIEELVEPANLRREQGARWQATTDDPRFRLAVVLRPGWYRAELQVRVPQRRQDPVHGNARFYLDAGEGESEAEGMGLPFHVGTCAERWLRVPRRARLRVDPVEYAGPFELEHFRLQRGSAAAARTAMAKRLNDIGENRAAASTEAVLWERYNDSFERPAEETPSYGRWIAEVEPAAHRQRFERWDSVATESDEPMCSVIIPAMDPPRAEIEAMLHALQALKNPNWELCVLESAQSAPAASDDARLRRIGVEPVTEPNRTYAHRDAAAQPFVAAAIEAALGEFIAFMDPRDRIAPQALAGLAWALDRQPDASLVYSDHDFIDGSGMRSDPFFKPDWSPDLFYSANYLGPAVWIRRKHAESVCKAGGSLDSVHDLLCRVIAASGDWGIVHVPDILCHRQRNGAQDDSPLLDRRSTRDLLNIEALVRRESPGARLLRTAEGCARIVWPLPEPRPRVSLIVPTRDGREHLRRCIESLCSHTRGWDLEILVVDNQSTCPETLAYLERIGADANPANQPTIRVLRYDHPFNFSAINNMAVREATGEVLGFLNDDVEATHPDWIEEVLGQVSRPGIGCVGVKLLYPEGNVQHAGIVLGMGGIAGHPHRNAEGRSPGYFGRLQMVHNVSAVTGAALFIRKGLYQELGGMDEERLVVAFNDVDLCLKALAVGYRNLWTPFAEFIHHESVTRGHDRSEENAARLAREEEAMAARWGERLQSDPYYNANLTQAREDFALAQVVRQSR
jgi:GT2 family glycosyltransferase